jgi:hypothetical protein
MNGIARAWMSRHDLAAHGVGTLIVKQVADSCAECQRLQAKPTPPTSWSTVNRAACDLVHRTFR